MCVCVGGAHVRIRYVPRALWVSLTSILSLGFLGPAEGHWGSRLDWGCVHLLICAQPHGLGLENPKLCPSSALCPRWWLTTVDKVTWMP